MARAVLDVNIIISALLSATGAPARVLRAWQDGRFDLIVSPLLVAELRRALAYPKVRRQVSDAEAEELLEWLGRSAMSVPDPEEPAPVRASDPGDDYLLALAASQQAVLVSGDRHLLSLGPDAPVLSAASFLDQVGEEGDLTTS